MAIPEWVRKVLRLRGVLFEELHHREAYAAQPQHLANPLRCGHDRLLHSPGAAVGPVT